MTFYFLRWSILSHYCHQQLFPSTDRYGQLKEWSHHFFAQMLMRLLGQSLQDHTGDLGQERAGKDITPAQTKILKVGQPILPGSSKLHAITLSKKRFGTPFCPVLLKKSKIILGFQPFHDQGFFFQNPSLHLSHDFIGCPLSHLFHKTSKTVCIQLGPLGMLLQLHANNPIFPSIPIIQDQSQSVNIF